MKLSLTRIEKKNLITDKVITIERELSYQPKSSIIFGIGIKNVWDEVGWVWVFGDAEGYIESMRDVDRRAIDYPDNTINHLNGSNWWGYVRDINPYSKPNENIISGRKNH